jgi:hypothetical protein
MFGNSLQVVLSTIEQSNTDISLLERTDIVRSVSSHEGDVAGFTERGENECFLRWRNSGIDPSVLDQNLPGWAFFILLECGTSDTNIVLGKKGRVEWFRRVDVDKLGLFDISPNEFWQSASVRQAGIRHTIGRGSFLQIQNHDISVYNFDVLGNVDSRQWIITSDHDTLLCQLQSLHQAAA